MNRPSIKPAATIATLLAAVGVAGTAHAQTALLNEGDLLAGQTITSLGNVATNTVGGYAVGVSFSGLSSFAGSVDGVAPISVFRTEDTVGTFTQTSFETFFGFGDAGQLAYSAGGSDTTLGTNLDSVWADDTLVLSEPQSLGGIPGAPAGGFSSFNSRPTATASGEAWWVGGISFSGGGSTSERALFRQGVGGDVEVVYNEGDVLGGSPFAVANVDFSFKISSDGENWINEVDLVDALERVFITGQLATAGGEPLQETGIVPVSIGGTPGETYDGFDNFGVNNFGSWIVTGETVVREFVMIDGMIVAAEGDAITLPDGSTGFFDGGIDAADINNDGDWAVIWEAGGGSGGELILVNGEVVAIVGQAADIDGDGAPDGIATIRNFTGIDSLALSERAGGNVSVYFTADVDTLDTTTSTDDVEILYRVDVAVDTGGCNPADLSSPTDPGVPDGVLTGADFFEFLDLFSAGDLSVDFSSPLMPGMPDGVLTGADFFEFLNLFSAGC